MPIHISTKSKRPGTICRRNSSRAAPFRSRSLKPHLAPAYDVESIPFKQKVRSSVHVLPLFILIFLVLGTMFFGVTTPTESAAIGAVGAFIVAACYGKLDKTVARKSLMSAV